MACRQACWAGSAYDHGKGHARCLDGRPANDRRLVPVPAYVVLQACHDQRPWWMNLCLPSRLFVQMYASAWVNFLLGYLFWPRNRPLVLACGFCCSLLSVGNFPECCCSVRDCFHASSAGCRAPAIPHACLGTYSLVRFDCCSSDPPGLFFPVTCGRSSGGLPIFGKQPLLRPVYVPFSRKSGIDRHQADIVPLLTFKGCSNNTLALERGFI